MTNTKYNSSICQFCLENACHGCQEITPSGTLEIDGKVITGRHTVTFCDKEECIKKAVEIIKSF